MILTKEDLQSLAEFTSLTAREAGILIITYYTTGIQSEIKSDGSPLTASDQASNDFIIERLMETRFLIVSEEAKELPFDSE